MSVWLWILIGGASWLALSLVVGVAVGAILRSTSRLELSKFIDHEMLEVGATGAERPVREEAHDGARGHGRALHESLYRIHARNHRIRARVALARAFVDVVGSKLRELPGRGH
jgi:hypothetical protein